ncbi:diguanylate cyclase domain-containing protein [Dactylosporangium sp. McL0621]|uniref:diguanylate cyclase domain-containing protein n=1 Tax=Dactylosporangium sp. McL0621 TaxID=3415678 RepID=UPI003CFA0A5F
MANRRRLTQHVADALGRHERVAVALIDIDDFKAINDDLGHGCPAARRGDSRAGTPAAGVRTAAPAKVRPLRLRGAGRGARVAAGERGQRQGEQPAAGAGQEEQRERGLAEPLPQRVPRRVWHLQVVLEHEREREQGRHPPQDQADPEERLHRAARRVLLAVGAPARPAEEQERRQPGEQAAGEAAGPDGGRGGAPEVGGDEGGVHCGGRVRLQVEHERAAAGHQDQALVRARGVVHGPAVRLQIAARRRDRAVRVQPGAAVGADARGRLRVFGAVAEQQLPRVVPAERGAVDDELRGRGRGRVLPFRIRYRLHRHRPGLRGGGQGLGGLPAGADGERGAEQPGDHARGERPEHGGPAARAAQPGAQAVPEQVGRLARERPGAPGRGGVEERAEQLLARIVAGIDAQEPGVPPPLRRHHAVLGRWACRSRCSAAVASSRSRAVSAVSAVRPAEVRR